MANTNEQGPSRVDEALQAALDATEAGQGGLAETNKVHRFDVTRRRILEVPPECPVTPLGVSGDRVYVLDAHAQLRVIPGEKLSRSTILHLFGEDTDWLYALWPKWKKEGEQFVRDDWVAAHAQESLMRACARRGIWTPQDFVRGRGAWALADGRLALHTGRAIYLSDGTVMRPGLIGRYVYPAAKPITEPLDDTTPGTETDARALARELLTLIETWQWTREINARLLLGWIGAALLAGAVKVRPICWISGERAAGKSTLTGEGGVIHTVLGDMMLTTANTTAAGLWQKIGFDALPVAVDEIEAKQGNARTQAVIELARQAFSGGNIFRGGQDHEGQEFRARTALLFSSILIPPMKAQDYSRLALLGLRPFPPGAQEPDLDLERLALTGRAMLRRVLEKWSEWPARFAAWRGFLIKQGHIGRAGDQFGTLLAAADLLLNEQMPDAAYMDEIAGEMTPDALEETASEMSDADRCVTYAMSRRVGKFARGEVLTAGEWIMATCGRYGEGDEGPSIKSAQRELSRAGMRVFICKSKGLDLDMTPIDKVKAADIEACVNLDPKAIGWIGVAFAAGGEGIMELFAGSDWEGQAGAHNPYTQALQRVDGAVTPPKNVRIGSTSGRVTVLPLDRCVDVVGD